MICTEEEAKTKWCPQARVSVPTDPSRNRCDNIRVPSSARCVASDCMMWEWEWDNVKLKGYCGMVRRVS